MGRRIDFPSLLVLVVISAVAVAFWFWPRSPTLVTALRSLPDVRSVTYPGPTNASLVVIHLRDWHYVDRELCEHDGINFDENLDAVEKVQADELAIALYLIRKHGLKHVYTEGATEASMPDLQLRLGVLKNLDRLDELGGMDDATRAYRREMLLEIGTTGRLLHGKEIEGVLPLEDDEAHANAKPQPGNDGVIVDSGALAARRRAMVKNLPVSGTVLIVLGGSHDLGHYLGAEVLYIRVTPSTYPDE